MHKALQFSAHTNALLDQARAHYIGHEHPRMRSRVGILNQNGGVARNNIGRHCSGLVYRRKTQRYDSTANIRCQLSICVLNM